jgi:GNAT superfamily N-acetyltransferase
MERCTRRDFDEIVTEHGAFWDNDLTLQLHHPIFLYEFGDTAYVVREAGQVVAYLFGFFAQTGPLAYVHMVAVRREFRGRGLARRLYAHFGRVARRKGCKRLKATAAPSNAASIDFHRSIGMRPSGEPSETGPAVARDYLKPGTDRVVLLMDLDSPEAEALLRLE